MTFCWYSNIELIYKEYWVNGIQIFVPKSSLNIWVKTASVYLERFQRYGVLKNVQLFWPTLYLNTVAVAEMAKHAFLAHLK